MCEMCLKQLRHEALEYFRCLYDDPDNNDGISEETYNNIISLHECMKLHELLKMIAEREEAFYWQDQKEKTVGVVEGVVETFHMDEDQKKEYMVKFKKLYQQQVKEELEKLYEELD